MSSNVQLNAEKREGTGKGVARQLRFRGRFPAVLYGKDMEAMHLSLDGREATHLFHSISVENTIIDLQVEGEKEPIRTLIREVQVHPFRDDVLHVDFFRIQKGVAVELQVPLHLTGTPHGVRMEGGILDQVLHDLHVRCIPSKIPEAFELDVTELELGHSLHVSDVPFEEGVEILTDPALTVCSVSVPKVVEAVVAEEEEGIEAAPDAAAEAAPEAAAGEDADEG